MNFPRLLNQIFLFASALVFVGLTFVYQNGGLPSEASGWSFSSNWSWGSPISGEASAIFAQRDRVLFLEGARGEVLWDEAQFQAHARLDSGSLFASTRADDFHVQVVTPVGHVNVEGGIVLLRWDEAARFLEIFTFEGPVTLEFQDDQGVLASLAIPSQTRLDVPLSKVTPALKKLRMTKLMKEFPVFELVQEELSEMERSAFLAAEQAYSEQERLALEWVRREGTEGPSKLGLTGYFWTLFDHLQAKVTVLPFSQQKLEASRKEEALRYSKVHFSREQDQTASLWLSEWESYPLTKEDLRYAYSKVFFALPGDALYPIKSAALARLYPQESLLKRLDRDFSELERVILRGTLMNFQAALSQYSQDVKQALDEGTFDTPESLPDLQRRYALAERLFRSHLNFYDAESMQLLSDLESRILVLSGGAQDAAEERQAIVQSKIRLLTKLFDAVSRGDLEVERAQILGEQWILDAQGHLEQVPSNVAIRSYFETELADFVLALEFTRAPDYAFADSFEDGLSAYRIKLADMLELNLYIQNARLGQATPVVAPLSLDEATKQAKDDLYRHKIQYRDVLSLGDQSNRLFDLVDARASGVSIKAKYDLETQILYDVVVGELRFPSGLKLQDASRVIDAALKNQTIVASPEEPQEAPVLKDDLSLTESVALNVARSQWKDLGFLMEDLEFKVLDLQNNLFSFEGVLTPARLVVRGEYDANRQMVLNVVWDLNGVEHPLPDLALDLLLDVLYETYRAVAE